MSPLGLLISMRLLSKYCTSRAPPAPSAYGSMLYRARLRPPEIAAPDGAVGYRLVGALPGGLECRIGEGRRRGLGRHGSLRLHYHRQTNRKQHEAGYDEGQISPCCDLIPNA